MKRSNHELSVIELCAGGGGAALGLEQAGFAHAALIDNNAHACATLRLNRPQWNVIEGDVREFKAEEWKGIDLLSGGLPCPPFSIAGKQLGADDDRDMFPAMLRIVEVVKPRAVLIENVRGIYTDRFASFRENINRKLDSLGFDVMWAAFNAVDFGVPQKRLRVFMVAKRRGKTSKFHWPTLELGLPATVGETIGDLMAGRGWEGAASWAIKASSAAPTIVGGSHKHGGPDLGPTRARKEWASLGVDGLGIANEPPPPDFVGMPRLTIPMVARLQSFPDDWSFAGRKTQAYRQVGNALPVRLAFKIAKAVQECLR
jgi:DNA (cytosine-5)-methyltransferase 1